MDRFRDIDSGIPNSGGGGRGNFPPRRGFGSAGGNAAGDGNPEAFGGRIPPQNIEAEMAILGAMMLGERGSVERASETIQREDFYREAHALIYESMLSLAEKDEPVDIVTLKDELGRRGVLDAIGGIGYLMQLGEFVPTTANLSYHAQIVREKAILRRLIEAASRIAGMAYSEVDEVDQVVDMAERTIFEVARKRSSQGFMPLRPLLNEAFDQVDIAYQEKGMVTGIDTGFEDLNYMTSGLQDGDLIILAARPSMGKCVKWDNYVCHPVTGERLTMREYVTQEIPLASRLNECGYIGTARVSHWVDSGVKPCWRVTTRSGRFVEVTGHHPFMAIGGWTPLSELAVGDKIAVPRRLSVFGSDDSMSLERVRLLAYLIAEGGLTRTSPVFTNTDPVLVADFHHVVATEFPACNVNPTGGISYRVALPRCGGKPNPCTVWLHELGLWGKLADTKAFPSVVWLWDRQRLAEFLKVLMSCDGTIYSMHGFPRIEFSVASEQLAHDAQHALTRFGIVSKLWQKRSRCWRVEVTEPESVQLYQAEIGWLGEKQARAYRMDGATRVRPGGNVGHPSKEVWATVRASAAKAGISLTELARRAGENVPANGYNLHSNRGIPRARLAAYAEILNDDTLRRIASPDIYWDEIVSLEPIGEHQVYDLTVPDGANFVAQDIYVHNTSLAVGIGQNVALQKERKSVAIFSLEMSREQLVQRMICSEARVDAHKLRTGFLQDDDWERLAQAIQRLWDANIYIDDTTDMGPLEMRAKCRRLRAEHGLDLVIVDYLQLMRGSGKSNSNRNEEITEISRGLKNIAREMKVPVIALAQLSRAVERREDKRPMLSDLRDSGSIEAEADLVSFIYRPAYYERKQEVSRDDEAGDSGGQRPGEYEGEEAEVIIAKHRNGPTGTVKVAFLARFARFDNLANRDDNPF